MALLFAVLMWRAGGIGRVADTLALAKGRPLLLASGVLFFCVSLLCGAARWYLLLRILRLPIDAGECIKLYAAGHFFNMLGPGALGGDVIKAAFAARQCPGRGMDAVASIAAERFIGFLGLAVFIVTVCLVKSDLFAQNTVLSFLRSAIFAAAFAAAVVLAVLLLADWGKLAERYKPRSGSFSEKAVEGIVRLWRTFRFCLIHPSASVFVFALSLLNHFADVCCYFILSRSIGMSVSLGELLAVTPVTNVLASVPLTPGGVGVRENIMLTLMSEIGVGASESAALSLLMFFTLAVWASAGGLIFLFYVKDRMGRGCDEKRGGE